MKPFSSDWLTVLALGIALSSAGCGYGSPSGGQGGKPEDSLRLIRRGPVDGCLFNATGAVNDSYTCSPLAVMSNASLSNGLATIVFSPGPDKTSASGMVQFASPILSEGTYQLSDLRMAVISIHQQQEQNAGWMCQSGPGLPTLGALKLQLTHVEKVGTTGSDLTYVVHGVLESLLAPVSPKTGGNVVFHAEF